MILASIKGFGPGKYEDCKVYENVAQCAGGAASTTGFREGPPVGDRGADRRQRHGVAPVSWGSSPRCIHREKSGKGQKVSGGHAGRGV